MQRKTLNLVLAAVAAGLVTLVVLDQKRQDAKIAEATKEGPPLTALDTKAITRVRLQHPGAPDIALEKQDGRWRLRAPVEAAADPVEVGRLLEFAGAKTHEMLDAKTLRRADFGLEKPATVLVLDDTAIALGDVEPIKYTRYVEVDAGKPGDTVTTIDDLSGTITDADYSDLVAKALLPAGADIAKLELPGLSLTRGADGKAWTTQPAGPAATAEAIDALVANWRGARAIANEALPVAAKTPDAAQQVVLTLADGSQRRYGIGAREPQLLLDDSTLGIRYRLAPDEAARLLALPAPKAAAADKAAGAGAAAPAMAPQPAAEPAAAKPDAVKP